MITLKEKLNQLKQEKKKAFIVYIPFGFPSIKLTRDILLTLQGCGVDAIELGLPFSDPLADGPIIQQATSLAIKKGANIDNFLKELSCLKKHIKVPIVVMTYYNPIFKFGINKFFKNINSLGVKAITVVDLPLEESKVYIKEARKSKLDTIFFITPTTTSERIKKIAKQSRGFIYYISVTGITGPKDFNYVALQTHIKSIKRSTQLPVCVGFGIHKKSQVERINKFSDGVIIGSSIVKFIEKHYRNRYFLNKLKTHIRSLKPRH